MRWLMPLWLGCVALLACDDALPAQVITPRYVEPCRYVDCAGHGTCSVTDAGMPQCTCDDEYTGDGCERCATAHHRDAQGRCIADVRCEDQAIDPCAPGGRCVAGTGVIECMCEPGYAGPRCNVCADRYARDDELGCLPLFYANDGGVAGSTGGGDAGCPPGFGGPGCMLCATGYHRVGTACAIDETCRATSCPPNASCTVIDGVVACACDEGYAGDHCSECASGYHAVDGRCVIDEVCIEESCPPNADCDIVQGVARCTCRAGWVGAQCEHCRRGTPTSLDFASPIGFPTETNTCFAPPSYPGTDYNAYQVGGAVLRSEAGTSAYRLCAPSTYNGMATRHVELATAADHAAEIELAEAATSIGFDYGTRLSALSLSVIARDPERVLADRVVGTLTLAPQSNGHLDIDLDPPARVIAFTPRNGARQIVSLDNIEAYHEGCE